MTPLKIALLITALSLLCADAGFAQRTTRGKKLTPRTERVADAGRLAVVADTIAGDSVAAIVSVTGYEKPLRASREAFFVANRDSLRSLEQLTIEITYCTVNGRMLHARKVTVYPQVPADERRLVSVRSWDRQNVFYYAHGDTPRTRNQATPYLIVIRPLTAVLVKPTGPL